jgi:hypothetical protein
METPTKVRDKLESRTRKIAVTYPDAVKIDALEEIIQIASQYRIQLMRRNSPDPSHSVTP